MNLLCVLPSIPLPTNTGGTLRTLNLIRALDASFDVTVLAPDRPGTDAAGLQALLRGKVVVAKGPEGSMRRFMGSMGGVLRGKPLQYEQYAPASLGQALEALLKEKQFAVVHFDHLHTAQLLPLVHRLQRTARTVIDEHNVEAQVVERMAEIAPLPMRAILRWQATRVQKLEAALISRADAVLTCSARDRGTLRWTGARSVEVVPNGVSIAELTMPADRPRDGVVFVGSLDWWPNADAALRLVKEIWPACAGRLGGTTLRLVGRNPSAELRGLAGPDIEVTGTVESVAPYLRTAWATAIPLRAGSGTRLKILEAAAARVPVVTTRLGGEGLPLIHGRHCLYAETPQEFADALLRLRSEPGFAAELAENAFHLAQGYDWTQIGGALVAFYRQWLGMGPATTQATAG